MRWMMLAAVAQTGIAAAASGYLIQSWEINQGLPQGSVLAIAQTHDRYLWIGTFGGLARFDGLTFTNFDAATTPGLVSNRIVALCEDRRGSLWIGTGEGGIAEYRDGRFRAYTEDDGLPSNKIRALECDGAGDVWIATFKGVVRRKSERFEVFPSESDVLALGESKGGGMLAGTNAGVSELRNGKLVPILDVAEPVLAVHQDRRGSVWLGTNDGLWRSEKERRERVPVTGQVRQILEDRAGTLWVGTSEGLWTQEADRWRRYTTADGLSEDWVRALVEDTEGNLWAGTNARGLNRLKRGSVDTVGTGAGLATENTVPVLEDREGAIWFGLNCGGLVRYRDGHYRVFTEKDGLGGNCVWSLWEDRAGTLWVGTRSGLTAIRGGKMQTYTHENSALTDNWVTSIYEDRAGALWIGTGNGLNRLLGGSFTAYRHADGLVGDDIRFITEDAGGAMWFGSTGGMSRLEHGQFTSWRKREGLPHDFVRAIHFDGAGTAWIGTYGGGLARFRDGRLTYFHTNNGLAENIVSRILEDAQGNLWLSGNHGIHRVAIRELEDFAAGKALSYALVSYGTSDGMKSAECNGGGSPAGWRGRDGRLWFPTQRGVAVLSPDAIQAGAQGPAVWIERAMVDRKQAGTAGEVRVPAGGSDLEIQYTGISLSGPEKVRFQFRLENMQSEWVDAGARRAAYYTHLPPGRYRFQVVAANGDGVWNREGAALTVVVVPQIWQTWWFRVLLLVTLAGAAAWAIRRRIRGIEFAAAQQVAYSQQLIASQESERQRIAAELHDSLGQTLAIIRNRALMSLNEPANQTKALEQMDEIADAAADALHEVREIAYDLRPFQIDRVGLRASIDSMVTKAAGSGTIQFESEIEDVDGVLSPGDRIHAYRVVQEAVNNVLKHSGARKATVRVRRAAGGLEILVSDDGKGFAWGPSTGSGFGLNGMAERARILGGKLTVDSGAGRGTMVQVVIPRGAHDNGR